MRLMNAQNPNFARQINNVMRKLISKSVSSCKKGMSALGLFTVLFAGCGLAVPIGNQVGMSENLKVTKYNDGIDIPSVTDNNSNRFTYGALYNWFAVNSGKLRPSGWHVPGAAEWTSLINFLGGEGIAGGKLKEIGTRHWSVPNTGAANESCDTAVHGGYLYNNRAYHSLGNAGHWWTATESKTDSALDAYFYSQNGSATQR